MLGGTLPYMAPEQIEAFLNPDLWGKVGARADIYSLGLVLRELLTGEAPDLPDEKLPPPRAMRALLDRRARLEVRLRRSNPDVPHALEAITERCLWLRPRSALSRRPGPGRRPRALPRPQAPGGTPSTPAGRERLGNWAHRNRRSLMHGPSI